MLFRSGRAAVFKNHSKMDMLGRAKSVKVQKENTVIVDGAGDKDKIQGRIKQIRGQIEETTSEFDKEKLQERLAKMAEIGRASCRERV